MKRKNKKLEKRETRYEVRLPIKEKIEAFLHSDSPSATATKFLLASLALGTVVFGGAIVPGILKALESSRSGDWGKAERYSKKQLNNSLGMLKRQKLIKITQEKDGRFEVKLTNKGKKRVLRLSLDELVIQKPNRWDGKWRIVIFDIPNEVNSARGALRGKMKELGFKQLQRSVWVYPYDCEDEIIFLAEALEVEKYVEIITAERILHEKVIRDAFKIQRY